MALLWVDGFEKYGTNNAAINPNDVLDLKYSNSTISAIDIVDGRHGGSAIQIDNGASHLMTPDLGPQDQTLIVGFNFKYSTIADGAWIIDLRHPSGDGYVASLAQFNVRVATVNTNNEIAIYLGNSSLTTTNGVDLQSDTWYNLALKVFCDGTVGTINLFLDGSEVITFNGDTQEQTDSGTTDRYSRVLLRKTGSFVLTYDDLYVMDGTGSTNNDVLDATARVETISPSADASGNWTPNTGSDFYAVLDEDVLDANYISETTTGNRVIVELGNLSANASSGTVQGVMLNCESQQTSRFKKYPKAITQNGSGGSVQQTGNFRPGNTNPLCHTIIMENDPDDNAWSAATVNDFRMGVEAS